MVYMQTYAQRINPPLDTSYSIIQAPSTQPCHSHVPTSSTSFEGKFLKNKAYEIGKEWRKMNKIFDFSPRNWRSRKILENTWDTIEQGDHYTFYGIQNCGLEYKSNTIKVKDQLILVPIGHCAAMWLYSWHILTPYTFGTIFRIFAHHWFLESLVVSVLGLILFSDA